MGRRFAHTDDLIATQPIKQVVTKSRGGNGLATRPFSPSAGFFLIRYQDVPYDGSEALFCNGKQIKRSDLWIELRRLYGKKPRMRRVLLNPEPRSDITIRTITQDGYMTFLRIAVHYTVKDPAAILKLEDAVSAIDHAAKGALSRIIPRIKQSELLRGKTNFVNYVVNSLRRDSSCSAYNIVAIAILELDTDTSERDAEIALTARKLELQGEILESHAKETIPEMLGLVLQMMRDGLIAGIDSATLKNILEALTALNGLIGVNTTQFTTDVNLTRDVSSTDIAPKLTAPGSNSYPKRTDSNTDNMHNDDADVDSPRATAPVVNWQEH